MSCKENNENDFLLCMRAIKNDDNVAKGKKMLAYISVFQKSENVTQWSDDFPIVPHNLFDTW